MNVLPKVALAASLLISGYAVFKILRFIAGVICVGALCARLGIRHEGFIPTTLFYLVILTIALAAARSAYKRLERP
jgi:hypothetical protein